MYHFTVMRIEHFMNMRNRNTIYYYYYYYMFFKERRNTIYAQL